MDQVLNPLRFGPPRAAAAGLILLAVLCAVVALGVDAAGRVLLGVTAFGAVGAAGWLLGGPVVAADAGGVRIRGALRAHVVPWAEVRAILVDARRRSRALEIETAEQLLAVPALLLGRVSPNRVAELLRARQVVATGQAPSPPSAH